MSFQHRNFGLDVMRAVAISLVLSLHQITNFTAIDIGMFWYRLISGRFFSSGVPFGTMLFQALQYPYGEMRFSRFQTFFDTAKRRAKWRIRSF